ncbi:glycosyl hydrolase [Draconibacterium sp. IB214405]|uniref:glycosyl hydrolase n=1 Tax=Draconibacterium sp. IB214405 TaxID=3097352 RepID=UPI002A0E764F|nr:glycosyl hydrolase [Draconibacterium sp. IB214405]MDX8339405.1 glycosyl hydrolase [Draconibacterium sp. IB214405]
MNIKVLPLVLVFSMLFTSCTQVDKQEGIALEQGFNNVPDAAKPRVWWHWMGGNVAWEGAKADMDWMTRVGIGGLQCFHAGMGQGPENSVVENYYPYMSDGWKSAFAKSAAYADQLGLEFATAASPGWSETGGPWVEPEDGMKKMVYAVTKVEGGKPYTGILNHPPVVTGVYQTSTGGSGHQGNMGAEKPQLYKDQKVLAFQVADGEILPTPKIIASGGMVNAVALSDGFYDHPGITLPAAKEEGGISWIQFDYGKPVTVRGLVLSAQARGPVGYKLESSNDGSNWTDTGADIRGGGVAHTNSVDNVNARYFRFVSIKQPPSPPAPWFRWSFGPPPPAPAAINFTELTLLGTPTVHSFEQKAAYFSDHSSSGYYNLPSGTAGTDEAIKTAEVLDLTDQLNEDGTLNWTPPAGQWMVLRVGYSLTGAQNRPAAPEATGLEVDKLDSAAIKRYMDYYIDMYREAADGLVGEKGLHALMFDSWESGFANWTPKILEGFQQNIGYDPTPWVPALAGYVVESPENTDKFLYDWRRNIQLMLKQHHYDFLTRYLHEIGMIRYGEAHEAGFATMGEGMEMKQTADIPMGAMWMHHEPGYMEGNYFNDNQESASVAHIYGQNIAATESFTGGPAYGTAPWDLKSTADAILLSGSNRFVIHTSAHQPITRGPGVTLGVGQMFSRNETWAEQSKVWIDYLSRSSYMLQAGKAANDIALFYGEESSMTAIYGNDFKLLPDGYRYDFVSADVVMNMLSVEDGALTTKSGMNYKAIFLGRGATKMTLPVLTKMKDFVEQGAVVIGTRPEGSPSLADDPAEVKEVLDILWPGGAVASVGKGKVFNTDDSGAAFNEIGLEPDFTYESPVADSDVMFLHRKLNNGGIYFVASQTANVETIKASFRISGYKAELWDPATGKISPVSYEFDGERTNVTIPLDSFGSIFVVFREKTKQSSVSIPVPTERVITQLEGPWQVEFQAERGAPASATFDKLIDFRESDNDRIKYFSGIANYKKSVDVAQETIDKGDVVIDLGLVNNLAEVWVNGQLAGTTWKPPYRVDITDFITAGSNEIEIKAVNTWVNRLIGDAQPGVGDDEKITLTTRPFYRANSPLVPAGLVGPVEIMSLATN